MSMPGIQFLELTLISMVLVFHTESKTLKRKRSHLARTILDIPKMKGDAVFIPILWPGGSRRLNVVWGDMGAMCRHFVLRLATYPQGSWDFGGVELLHV